MSQTSTERNISTPEEEENSVTTALIVGDVTSDDDVTVRRDVHDDVEHVQCGTNGNYCKGESVGEDDDKEEEDGDEEDDDGLPIDRGWGWVVAVAAHLNALIMVGYTRSLGILFLEFLRVFQTSVTMTTMITGVMAGSYGVSVFMVMQVLMGRFKERNLVITGALISTAAIIVSVFARNVLELILSQGIFVGMGHALIFGPAIVLIGKYFRKKRSLATSIGNSGISSGAVFFPLLTRFLIREFGLRGALLIIGGVNFHMLAFALLLRPIESFRRGRKPKDDVELELLPKETQQKIKNTTVLTNDDAEINLLSKETQEKIENTTVSTKDDVELKLLPQTQTETPTNTENTTELFRNITESEVLHHTKTETVSCIEGPSHKNPSLSAPLHSNTRQRSKSECSRISDYHSQTDVFSFIGQSELVEKTKVAVCEKLKRFCSGLGFELWKNPLFLTLAFCNTLAIFLAIFLAYYPAIVVELGGTEEDGATFLSIAGAIDFFARLSAGYFADLGYMKRTHICAVTLALSALLCQFLHFFTTFWLQLMGAVLYGLFGGVFSSFIPVLLVDLLGMKNLSKSLGFVMIQHGLAIGVYHPIVGGLRDTTGSYRASFHCMGAAAGLASISLLLEPVVKRWVKKEEEEGVQ